MITYIQETVANIVAKDKNLSNHIFILPSKRACSFLKKELLQQTNTTQFAPEILSIEEFVEKVADLKTANPIELLFEFYKTYHNNNTNQTKESFDSFASWATLLIDDFNEIDRNLVNQKELFNYLKQIKEIEHWYVKQDKTTLVKNYIKFWNSLPNLYNHFVNHAKERGYAHQGYVYREATINLEHYIEATKNFKHIFIGFNALNTAEETIIKELLELSNTQVYWDAEHYFMEKPYHSASHFHRKIKSTWKYYQTHPFNWISKNYETPKNITITACTKNIGQVTYVSQLLRSIPQKELEKTALILADENLLVPLLSNLPNTLPAVNITMGLKLQFMPATPFFEHFIKLHQDAKNSFYYKPILKLINHPIGKILLPKSSKIIEENLLSQNHIHVSFEHICQLALEEEVEIIKLLFSPLNQTPEALINHAIQLILTLKESTFQDIILTETLYKLYEVWNSLARLNQKYQYIKNPKTVFLLFKEITAFTSINFQGEPYQGLQIMGLLETRSLDFENVILVSANEGILPAGKTNKSFIPFDLKKEYKLPSFKEKDALYAYHFYRLLHRAKNIHLLYNNHTSGIHTAEKSRFLVQLLYESPTNHIIEEQIYSPQVNITAKKLKYIEKTPEVMVKLQQLAASGFSPSALTTYIRNPMDFYEKYILKINELIEIEESIASNTLGTIVHDTLQHLYEPYLQTVLTEQILKTLQQQATKQLIQEFSKTYKKGTILTGKNRIIFEVSKRYIHQFLKQEALQIQQGNTIIIKKIENNLTYSFNDSGVPFPIQLKGKVDRIDQFNDTMRIIDYKTGIVTQTELNLVDWDLLCTDYKKNHKIVQVLTYALMTENELDTTNTQAGIISFKNLNQGFMAFTKKKTPKDRNGISKINKEMLQVFKAHLGNLIVEICNPEIPFIEKEIKEYEY